MILSSQDKRTRVFAAGGLVPAWESFRRQAEKRLAILESAQSLSNLGALASNRLEALRGKRVGQWSIRVNLQWRLCFEWPDEALGPRNVEMLDYH